MRTKFNAVLCNNGVDVEHPDEMPILFELERVVKDDLQDFIQEVELWDELDPLEILSHLKDCFDLPR